jgi:hypothetical protein
VFRTSTSVTGPLTRREDEAAVGCPRALVGHARSCSDSWHERQLPPDDRHRPLQLVSSARTSR